MAINEMKALSIAQPWAECIVSKGKNVENRSWNTKFRGYFAIHASASLDSDRFEVCKDECRIALNPDDVPFGAVVGFAELVEVITEDEVSRDTKKWFGGEYGFVLKNVIKLKKPIPAKGALSFWKVNGALLKACMKQLSSMQIKKMEKNLLSNER